MAYPFDVGIGATWFIRRWRFVSGGSGGTIYFIGGYGDNSMIGIYGEWACLDETLPDAVSSYARLVPVLLGQG